MTEEPRHAWLYGYALLLASMPININTMEQNYYAKAVGLEIELIIIRNDPFNDPFDLSEAETKQFIFKKPDSSIMIKDVNFRNGKGENGKLVYITTCKDDLDQSGIYLVQAYVKFKDNLEFYSEIATFTLNNILNS